MSEDALRAELDESNDMLSEALGLLAEAHAKMLEPICVHCHAKPGADAKETHWRECENHPAHRAVARLESELREARERILEGVTAWDKERACTVAAESALSAERTARRVMKEALERIGGHGWRRPGLGLTVVFSDLDAMVRAALAAEPGEGKNIEGHPRAAEGAATPGDGK